MPSKVPIDLSDLKSTIESVGKDPSKFLEEEKYVDENFEKSLKIEELETKKEYNKLLQQNRIEKKKYAKLIFILTCIWTALIFIIVIGSGLKCINDRQYFEFILSDKVIITLITSTTINFFGFFLLVIKYLFNRQDIVAASTQPKVEQTTRKP